MAGASTTYDINLRYMMEDKVSRKAQAMEKTLHGSAKSAGMLRRALIGAGAAAATFFGFRAAKGALIDFNADMQQAKNTMAGMLQLNVGGNFADNFRDAEGLVADLQQRAKASVGTTKDFVDVASLLVRPFAAANIPVEKMGELTQGVVVASRAMGVESSMAARDMEAALMGNLRNIDRFARGLGLVPAEFNKLSAAARAAKLEEALTQPAIADMAKAQEKSFDGVVSTFEDNLQIALGKVGLPLFEAITDEVKSWNMWFDKNASMLESMGREFGATLVGGFETVKEVGAFFVENRNTLMMLAKMWIGAKLIGAGARGISGGIGSIGKLMEGFKELSTTLKGGGGVVGGMKGLSASLGPLTIAIGLMAGALHHFMATLEDRLDEANRLTAEFGTTGFQAFRNVSKADVGGDEMAARRTIDHLRTLGLLGAGGKLQGGEMVQQLKQVTDETRAELSRQIGAGAFGFDKDQSAQQQAAVLGEVFRKSFERVMQQFGPDILKPTDASVAADAAAGKQGVGKGGPINVRITKIEVVSDDPDRFVVGMMDAITDLARNPNSAVNSLEER